MKTIKTIASFVTTLALLALMSLPVAAQPDPGRRPGGGNPEALFPSQTVPKNEREKKIVAILEDMDRTQRRGSMSVPASDGRLLRILAESTGAKHVVELGTSIGYSGLWF
jgi:hypothetical protein